MKTKKRYQDMNAAELAEATKEFDEPWTGNRLPGRAMTRAERARFEAWQKKSLAFEAQKKEAEPLTLLFPPRLVTQIGVLAKAKHTTPAILVKQIVQDAIHQAVA